MIIYFFGILFFCTFGISFVLTVYDHLVTSDTLWSFQMVAFFGSTFGSPSLLNLDTYTGGVIDTFYLVTYSNDVLYLSRFFMFRSIFQFHLIDFV